MAPINENKVAKELIDILGAGVRASMLGDEASRQIKLNIPRVAERFSYYQNLSRVQAERAAVKALFTTLTIAIPRTHSGLLLAATLQISREIVESFGETVLVGLMARIVLEGSPGQALSLHPSRERRLQNETYPERIAREVNRAPRNQWAEFELRGEREDSLFAEVAHVGNVGSVFLRGVYRGGAGVLSANREILQKINKIRNNKLTYAAPLLIGVGIGFIDGMRAIQKLGVQPAIAIAGAAARIQREEIRLVLGLFDDQIAEAQLREFNSQFASLEDQIDQAREFLAEFHADLDFAEGIGVKVGATLIAGKLNPLARAPNLVSFAQAFGVILGEALLNVVISAATGGAGAARAGGFLKNAAQKILNQRKGRRKKPPKSTGKTKSKKEAEAGGIAAVSQSRADRFLKGRKVFSQDPETREELAKLFKTLEKGNFRRPGQTSTIQSIRAASAELNVADLLSHLKDVRLVRMLKPGMRAGDRTPDFLAVLKNGKKFFVEVTTQTGAKFVKVPDPANLKKTVKKATRAGDLTAGMQPSIQSRVPNTAEITRTILEKIEKGQINASQPGNLVVRVLGKVEGVTLGLPQSAIKKIRRAAKASSVRDVYVIFNNQRFHLWDVVEGAMKLDNAKLIPVVNG